LAGQELVQKEYSIDLMVNSYRDLYESVLSEKINNCSNEYTNDFSPPTS